MEYLTLDQWQKFVEGRADSCVFHHRNWIELLMRQYHWKLYIPALRRDGAVTAAVPLLETKGLLGGRRLVCLPFSDCVPVLGASEESLAALRDGLRNGPLRDHRLLVVRSDRPWGPTSESHCVRHVVDLGRPFADVEAGFNKSGLRRNLRRAQSSNLQYEHRTDTDAMSAFYRLHLATRKKLGIPIQPKRFFDRLHELVIQPGLGFVGVATKERQPIAAAVFLAYNKTVIYKYGASLPAALEHRPNEFVTFNAMQWAGEQGYSCFDFGISSKRNEGLCRYKRKWGAIESEAYHVYLRGEPGGAAEDSRTLKFVSFIIRNSPPAVCRAVGEVFYRFAF